MKNNIQTLLSGFMAGLLISIAGAIYLYLKEHHTIIGAFLFGFGLLCVVGLDYKLYTGRIGYLIDHKKDYIFEILWIILGNILGAISLAILIHLSDLNIVIASAKILVNTKLANNYLTMFGLSVLCGMMMYLGVDGYKRIDNLFAKVVVVICAVVIFVLLGFEHSVANTFYFMVAQKFELHMVLSLIIMFIGNGIGAILLNIIEKTGHLKKPNQ